MQIGFNWSADNTTEGIMHHAVILPPKGTIIFMMLTCGGIGVDTPTVGATTLCDETGTPPLPGLVPMLEGQVSRVPS